MTSFADGDVVKLNIGGFRYTTTAGTLRSKGENYFTALLSGRLPVAHDEEGAIFIDRNGRYFEPILDFLRTGAFALPLALPWRLVAPEAEFFLVRGVIEYFGAARSASTLLSSATSDTLPTMPDSSSGSRTSLTANIQAMMMRSQSPPTIPEHTTDDPADIVDLNAATLRERLLARPASARDAFTAFAACMRAVQRASTEGATGVTLVLGEPEGAITRQGFSGFRRYQRPRFIERLQVVGERVLETMMASECGRETLYLMLTERGFAVRFLSVPCTTTAAAGDADSTFHDGMLVYWGSVPIDQLLTAARKDVFSL